MKDDVILLRAIATDNLVSRNGARIPASELPALANFLKGKPAIRDHRMFSTETAWGRVVTTTLERATPPGDLVDYNQAIVAAEGYWQIACEIAVQPGHSVLESLEYERVGELSITFLYSEMRCPNCSCGEAIWSEKCVNDFWDLPYYERHGVTDAFEISLVVVPAVQAAKVVGV